MRKLFLIMIIFCLTSCGFHLRGTLPLPPPLLTLYLQTPDPYGQLARGLQQFLKLSGARLVAKPQEATTILTLLREEEVQQLLGISGTQQTRQYSLSLVVTFQITNPQGLVLVPPQTLTETRTLTIKSDQILAGSNEAASLYQQMRQAIIYDILSRLASKDIQQLLQPTS